MQRSYYLFLASFENRVLLGLSPFHQHPNTRHNSRLFVPGWSRRTRREKHESVVDFETLAKLNWFEFGYSFGIKSCVRLYRAAPASRYRGRNRYTIPESRRNIERRGHLCFDQRKEKLDEHNKWRGGVQWRNSVCADMSKLQKPKPSNSNRQAAIISWGLFAEIIFGSCDIFFSLKIKFVNIIV